MGFDYIVIAPLLLSCCGFSFVFGCGVSFFGEFQCLPVNDCSAVICDSGALTRGSEHTSFYSAISTTLPDFPKSQSEESPAQPRCCPDCLWTLSVTSALPLVSSLPTCPPTLHLWTHQTPRLMSQGLK